MLLETDASYAWRSPWEPIDADFNGRPETVWTVLLPFFNERLCLADTLASLAAQDRPFRLILIDNGSTDGSGEIATAACRRFGLRFTLLRECKPGKVNALATGLELVRTPFVATCDADTWYPSDYLSKGGALLGRDSSAAAGAYFVRESAPLRQHVVAAWRIVIVASLFPRQCHTGGAGQVFRTSSLRDNGGFDPSRWNYVLEDHEIIHRVMRHGTMRYAAGLWCSPSDRLRDRAPAKWTLFEQLCYHATMPVAGDWFFYRFLAPRLAARRLTSESLRERSNRPIERGDACLA